MVVSVGFTILKFEPKTEPTELSILKVFAVPPEIAQDKTACCPEMIADGEEVKYEITGKGVTPVVAVLVTASGFVPLYS